jgi:multidrug efflux pump subunit AcrA (membrane-fusion protein)
VLATVNVKRGDLIKKGQILATLQSDVENQPMLEIAQIDPLNIEVILPVDLFGKVKLGMNATIVPVVFSEAELVAKVTIIDRVVDAASGTFGVRLEMANPGYRLPSGLKCTVFLEAPQPYSNIG